MMYVQCDLRCGNYVDVRWIPEKLAKTGKTIKVKDSDTLWDVTATYGKADEKQVIEMRDLYKHHRKGTDI